MAPHAVQKHPEIGKLLSVLSKVSSYFNQSGLRFAELKQRGKTNKITVFQIPKIFEVRWTEYSSVSHELQDPGTAFVTKPLLGAFGAGLAAKITGEDGEMKSVKLWHPNEPNNFPALRKGILESIVAFLSERFEADEALLKTIDPIIKFESDADIEQVHEMVTQDLSLPRLSLQFQDIWDKSLSGAISILSVTNESKIYIINIHTTPIYFDLDQMRE